MDASLVSTGLRTVFRRKVPLNALEVDHGSQSCHRTTPVELQAADNVKG